MLEMPSALNSAIAWSCRIGKELSYCKHDSRKYVENNSSTPPK